MSATRKYESFAEFYSAYLSQHSNRAWREWRFMGATLALPCFAMLLLSANPWWIVAALLCDYGCTWIGHLLFEKDRPATFTQPLYSFMSNWVMYWQMLTGQMSF